MNFLKRFFRKQENKESKQFKGDSVDKINKNYICLSLDPINTVNDLRVGDWNMDKVREGFATGFNRYAYQSEVDEAKRIGRIPSDKNNNQKDTTKE